jgi:hypothetical protein
MAMAMTLQTDAGATIVDDQPGKESVIQNFNSDAAKLLSQITAGYSIRNSYVQKMAPGDHQFHLISYDGKKKFNEMKTFPSRKEADDAFTKLGNVAKIIISGETGDLLVNASSASFLDGKVFISLNFFLPS